jgi:hypothetical protein
MDNYFDGRHETVHLEHGQSYGIPRKVYQALAQAAISAHELAGIEPTLLEHLSDNRPGCLCTLYGKEFVFTIQVVMNPPPVVVLNKQALDECGEFVCVCGGDANSFAVWRGIVSHMLKAEGFTGATFEEIEAWNREHGFT